MKTRTIDIMIKAVADAVDSGQTTELELASLAGLRRETFWQIRKRRSCNTQTMDKIFDALEKLQKNI